MHENPRATDACSGPTEARKTRILEALLRMYPFLSIEHTLLGDDVVPRANLQITTRCHQACPFCQAVPPQPQGDPDLGVLKSCLTRLKRLLPGAKLVLTGGEPTMRQDLPELILSAVDLAGPGMVEVQTNAVAIGGDPRRYIVPRAEGVRFLVALHGLTDSVYNACTQTAGQLPLAIAGIGKLLEIGVVVELNCVVSTLNIDHLEEYIERLSRIFPSFQSRRPRVHFSIMGIPEHRDVTSLLVRFQRLLTKLDAALDTASRHGITTSLSLSAGHVSIPVCLLDDRMKQRSEYPRMYEHEGSSLDAVASWWCKGDPCTACQLSLNCRGLPTAYAARFGFDELAPLSR